MLFILILFLGNLRAGLLVASVIPLSMLFAISMMTLFGVSGNLMSLGALDFRINSRWGGNYCGSHFAPPAPDGQFPRFKAHLTATDERRSEGCIRKINECRCVRTDHHPDCLLPHSFLQGIEGKMFKPMAETVAFAILGAFLLSLTYVPMIEFFVLNKTLVTRPSLLTR